MSSLRVVDDQPDPRVPTARVGRLHRYSLRVSLLEQCPFHCPYCLPGSVTPPTEKARWLTPGEHARIAPLFSARGTVKVRFTGGEPLARKDVTDVIAAWRAAAPGVQRALTTNGQRLASAVGALKDAGLERVTVHIDTLRADRYAALMGDGSPELVLEACAEAARAGLAPKLNVVVQRGRNDDELEAFLALSQRTGLEVRFIELMDTGSAHAYTREHFVTGAEIVAAITRTHGAVPVERRHASDPAALFRTTDGVVFGVIASDTQPFCADCDRLRLTADGRLRGCLYQSGGIPLGAALRSGATDATLQALLDDALDDKRSFHPLASPHRVPFSMADVGG